MDSVIKNGDNVWYVDSVGGLQEIRYCMDNIYHRAMYKSGWLFKTEEEAYKNIDRIREETSKFLETGR